MGFAREVCLKIQWSSSAQFFSVMNTLARSLRTALLLSRKMEASLFVCRDYNRAPVMCLNALTGVAIFAFTTVSAFAQDGSTGQAPKPTLADVQHLAKAISGDKSKLRAYCELGELHDQTQQAVDEKDAKTIEALVAKTDALELQLGPEYDKVIEGLDQIDLSSAEGQEIADVFKTLQEKCE
jgi:hypothetical protein